MMPKFSNIALHLALPKLGKYFTSKYHYKKLWIMITKLSKIDNSHKNAQELDRDTKV